MKKIFSQLLSCVVFTATFFAVGQIASASIIVNGTSVKGFERGSNPFESNLHTYTQTTADRNHLEYYGNAGRSYAEAYFSTVAPNEELSLVTKAIADGRNVDSSAEAYGYGQISFIVTTPTPFFLYDSLYADPNSIGTTRNGLYGYNVTGPPQFVNWYNANYSGVIYSNNSGYVTGMLLPGIQYLLYSSSYSLANPSQTSTHSNYVKLYTQPVATPSVLLVPEPSSLALLGLGSIGTAIGAFHRRRRSL